MSQAVDAHESDGSPRGDAGRDRQESEEEHGTTVRQSGLSFDSQS